MACASIFIIIWKAFLIVNYICHVQGKTRSGALQFDLVTNRDGSKYYVKPKPVQKDMSWKDSVASATLQVGFEEINIRHILM